MADGKIIIDTLLDSTGLEKGVNGLGGKLGSLAKGGLSVFVKGVAAISTALAGAGLASINLASDLGEVQNVVDTTFGDNAGKINDWAKNAKTSFGMSELQAKQFNGTMGAMLKSMGLTSDETLNMSENMVGLSGDFASFYNLKPEEAFDKIRSGISGETEPLKQLGINMSVANLEAYALAEGLSKPYNEMTQSEQAMLRYNYLMSVSKDAQGDFAKTSDSLANQLRIAKLNIQDLGSSIGTALLPMAQEAVSGLNGMMGQLKESFDKGGFDGLAGALGDVLSQIIVKIAEKAPAVINAAISIIQSFITGIQNNLPAIIGAAITIIDSLVTGLIQMLPQLLQMGITILLELYKGIAQMLPTLIPLAIQCIMSLIDTIIMNLPLLLNAGLQIITGLVTGILAALPQLIAMLPTIITSIVSFIVNSYPIIIQTGVKLLLALINGLITALPQLLAMLPQIIDSITTVISSNLPVILQAGITILLALINGLVTALPQLIAMLPRIIDSVIKVITDNLPMILQAGITILLALINGLVNALPQLIGMLPTIINTIVKVLTDNLPMIINAAVQIIIALIGGLIQAIPQLIASIPKIIVAIVKAFNDINWGEIGINILTGIGKGLIAGIGSVIDAAKKAASKIKDTFTNFFDIHSPSRVMRDLVGVNLVKGIGVGFDVETPNLEKDIDKNLTGMLDGIDTNSLSAKLTTAVYAEQARTTSGVVTRNAYKEEVSSNKNTDDIPEGSTFIVKNYMDSEEISEYTYKKTDGKLALAGKRVR